MIMEQNICHFVPFHKDYHSIHTIHFVLETKPQVFDRLRIESVCKMYYVCSGSGFLHTTGRTCALKEGDIFFTFPADPFCIETLRDLTYMYISFTGLRGNMIMEKLKISNKNYLFHNCSEVENFWTSGLNSNPEFLDLISESVLLYTFSYLGGRLTATNKGTRQSSAVLLIQKYIDDHFTDPDFSLDHISSELSYNKKYISYTFKKHMGIGIIEYLHTIRIQNACSMMKQGFTSVSDIANKCGYTDAQYFSKIFKEKMGLSPMAYMK